MISVVLLQLMLMPVVYARLFFTPCNLYFVKRCFETMLSINTLFFTKLSNHLIIYLYFHGLMDSCLTQWAIIYWDSTSESPFEMTPLPLHISISFFKNFFIFWHNGIFQISRFENFIIFWHNRISQTHLELSLLQSQRTVFRNQDLTVRSVHANWGSLFSGSLGAQK